MWTFVANEIELRRPHIVWASVPGTSRWVKSTSGKTWATWSLNCCRTAYLRRSAPTGRECSTSNTCASPPPVIASRSCRTTASSSGAKRRDDHVSQRRGCAAAEPAPPTAPRCARCDAALPLFGRPPISCCASCSTATSMAGVHCRLAMASRASRMSRPDVDPRMPCECEVLAPEGSVSEEVVDLPLPRSPRPSPPSPPSLSLPLLPSPSTQKPVPKLVSARGAVSDGKHASVTRGVAMGSGTRASGGWSPWRWRTSPGVRAQG
mmetsp:Transcript_38592/g.122320  ORF Transcript_38592/g.122320 Transcript_38592/m.122320 type:complete len:264 (-) Transcript_38592:5650-6441(-)